MLKAVVFLACLIAALGARADEGAQAELLRRVCAQAFGDKQAGSSEATPRFSSAEKLLSLIEFYESNGNECPGHFASSFSDLKALLADQALKGDICSSESYAKIRQFHLNYMHFYRPELTLVQLVELKSEANKRAHQRPIPLALAEFFIIFVKQINGACKQRISAKLDKYVNEQGLVSQTDVAVINQCLDQSKRLMKFGSSGLLDSIKRRRTKHFSKLEVFGVELDSAQDEDAKLYVQVKFDDPLKRVHDACMKRFKPVYDQVFVPVIRLNNLGYVDHSHSKLEDERLESDESLTKWFDIIQVCELFKDVEVLIDTRAEVAFANIVQQFSHLKVKGDDISIRRDVNLLTRDQALELKRGIENSENILPIYDPDLARPEHEALPLAPRLWLHNNQRQISVELSHFERDLDKTIDRKCSFLSNLTEKLIFSAKSIFYENKEAIKSKDRSNPLGRLAAFVERHHVPIRIALTLIGIAVFACHFG